MKIRFDNSLSKGEVVTQIDCSIITTDKAILTNKGSLEYCTAFYLMDVYEGLIIENNRYFVFLHNLLTTPRGHYRKSTRNQSWDIYEITPKLAQKFIKDEYICKWETFFDCSINRNYFYNWVAVNNHVVINKFSSYVKSDELWVDSRIIPAIMTEFEDIDEFLKKHRKTYPITNKKFVIDKIGYRDHLLSFLI